MTLCYSVSFDEYGNMVRVFLLNHVFDKVAHFCPAFCRIGKQGSLIAVTKGTTISEVTKHLAKIPEKSRLAVEEVTMDFSDSMMGITKQMFPNAEIVIDCFHILHVCYKRVGKSRIRELIAVRDTIRSKEEYVLNYFNNRSTNAAAESLNSKKKGFRAQVRGVSDLPFFMYRMM